MSRTDKKRYSRKGVMVRRILLAVLGLILGGSIYMVNAHLITGNQLPMPFGYGMASVQSGSMEPTFAKGALLFVKKQAEDEKVETGSIVVYQSGSELIVHRVISAKGDTVVTQGDANDTADQPFDRSQIKGRVLFWIPHLGTVTDMLRTPAGIVLILIAAFLLVELSFRRQRRAEEDDLEAMREEIRRLREESGQDPGRK